MRHDGQRLHRRRFTGHGRPSHRSVRPPGRKVTSTDQRGVVHAYYKSLSTGSATSIDFFRSVAIDDDIYAAGLSDYNTTNGQNTLLAKFNAGVGLETTYVQQDANYDVTSLTDDRGRVIERYRYTAYGERTVLKADGTSAADPTTSRYGFAIGHQGGRIDAATGLINFRHREYLAGLGRWTARDPAGYIDGLSVYLADRSNPTGYVDSSGYFAFGGPSLGASAGGGSSGSWVEMPPQRSLPSGGNNYSCESFSSWDPSALFDGDAWEGLLQIHENEAVNEAAAREAHDRLTGVAEAIGDHLPGEHTGDALGKLVNNGVDFNPCIVKDARDKANQIINRTTDGIAIVGGLQALDGLLGELEALEALEAEEAEAAEGCGSTANCFLAGTDVLLGDGVTEEHIEDIHVGQRVATDGGVANSKDGKTRAADVNATAVDRKTWRLVTLEIDARATNGGVDVMQVQELMPLATLEAEHAEVGAHIAVPLDLGDINEVGEGAIVESIDRCPKIQSGPGRVVLSTITHLNGYGFHLTLANAAGKSETLGVTGFHKLYTEDRGWQSTADLRVGELIRGDHGDLTVVLLARDPGVHRVYNLTVEADHVFYVGKLTALSHNIIDCDPTDPDDIRRNMEEIQQDIQEQYSAMDEAEFNEHLSDLAKLAELLKIIEG